MQTLNTIFDSNQFNFTKVMKEFSSDDTQTRSPSPLGDEIITSHMSYRQPANGSGSENFHNDSNIMFGVAYPNGSQATLNHPEDFLVSHEDQNKEINLIGGNDQNLNTAPISTNSKKITKLYPDHIILKEEKLKGKKRPWQPAEDAKVLELLANYGQSWALIAAALGNRTGKQVRDRYLNYLRPDIKDEDFDVQEDRLLLALYYQLGAKWSKIASHIPGRTECQVKNRFYAHIKKRLMFPEFNAQNMAKVNSNEAIFLDDDSSEKRGSDFKSEIEKKEEFFVSGELSQSSPDEYSFVGIPSIAEPVSGQFQSGNIVNVEQNSHMQGNVCQNQPFADNQIMNPLESLNKLIEPFNQTNRSQMNINLDRNQTEGNHNEQNHAHALLSLESEYVNRDKMKRYEELVRRKNALEFFYTKTLQEMNSLNIVGFGVPGMM